jgi:Tfp pilus assembly protein PilF
MTSLQTACVLICLVCPALTGVFAADQSAAPVFRDDDLIRYREGSRRYDPVKERETVSDIRTLKDSEAIFHENERAVCAVAAYDASGKGFSHGSCFIVNRDGVVVTSLHILSTAESARVKAGGRVFDVEGVLYADREHDVMVLKTAATGLPGVKLGDSRDMRPGERVFLMDSNQGKGNRIIEGSVSGLRDVNGRRMLQLTLLFMPGSSGGPIFNLYGDVIGIAAMIVSDGKPVSFAVPIEAVKDRLTPGSILSLKEALSRDRRQAADYWVGVGDEHSGAGRYQEALDAYRKALDVDPDSVTAYNGIGVVSTRMKRYDEAVASYDQALRRDPDSAWTRSNLGLAYLEMRKYPEAIETLRQAVKSMPDLSVAHLNLGIAYAKTEQYRAAAASYQEAIRLSPSLADAYFGLGLVYLALHDRKAALRQHEILQQIDPEQAKKLWERIRE